jgi:hypothetical protein
MAIANLTISDGSNSINFFAAGLGVNLGWIVELNGLDGMGAEHLGYTEYTTPNMEGARVGRPTVANRKVTLIATLWGTSADNLLQQERALRAMLDEAARWAYGTHTQGRAVTVTYQPHAATYPVQCALLYGTLKRPKNYASPEVAPGLHIRGYEITLVMEPYWTEATYNLIHNLLPDFTPFGDITGWSVGGSGATQAIVSGGIVGPYCYQYSTVGSTLNLIHSPATASLIAGNIFMQAWINIPLLTGGATVTANLENWNGSAWVTVCAVSIPVNPGGWDKCAVKVAAAIAGNLVRVTWTINPPPTGGLVILISGLMIANNSVAGVPALGNTSPVSCTYSLITTGEDTTASPEATSRMYVYIDGAVQLPGSTYVYSRSEAPALTTLRLIQQAGGSGTVRAVTIGRRSVLDSSRDARWSYLGIDQNTPGYSAGAHTTVDSTGTGTWGARADVLQFTPASVNVAEAVAAWNLNSWIVAGGFAPSGWWRVFAVIGDVGVSSSVLSQGKFDFWIEAGIANDGTSRQRTNLVSLQNCAISGAAEDQLLSLGNVELAVRMDRTQFQPTTFWLRLLGRNTRGAGGISARIDSLYLVPADEAIFTLSGPDTSYLTPTTGQGIVYDGGAIPPYAGVVDTNGADFLSSWQVAGDPLTLNPGEPTLLHLQTTGIYGRWAKNVSHVVEFRVKRRRGLPADS